MYFINASTMENTTKQDVIKELQDLECCYRCILYHLNAEPDDFIVPTSNFNKLNTTEDEKHEDKKSRKNVCRLCLDVLQDKTLDDIVHAISQSSIHDYQYNDFFVNVSLPKSVYVRQHAISVYLKKKYPNYLGLLDPTAIAKVVKYSINNKISESLNKRQSKSSNFEINLNIGYVDDEKEVENVFHLNPRKFNSKKPDKNKEAFISRNSIFEVLNSVKDNLFEKYFPDVPSIPTNFAQLLGVTFLAAPLYIGGRYLKLGRNICQTPWIIDDKKVNEHCVQDILFDAIEKYLGKQSKMVFTSSGREDADVRMLGNGRPFYIQVENPKNRYITKDQYKLIEEEVSQSKLVAVLRLQTVYKSDIVKIKDGEENKRKTYNALCVTTAPDVTEVIEKINSYGPVELSQRTPLRVLHRRNQAVRQRNIYKMKAKSIEGRLNMFELECVTQAGTYVKEFVHGDFERTVPNLGKITGYPCDIVALDVVDIDLEWPGSTETQINGDDIKIKVKCIV